LRLRWATKSDGNSLSKLNIRVQKPQLDWRSVSSINETARLIRRDIRKHKISYYLGMSILIRARNQLMSLIRQSSHDRRLAQVNHEIRITKKLFKDAFGNPLIAKQYKLMGAR
jgi:hypothetical protein